MNRHLSWEGCWNARDLGGLRLEDGGHTRWGAVVRSESLQRVTAQGWSQIHTYGIRTIVDLRNLEQSRSELQAPLADITRVQVPLEQDLHEHPDFALWASGGLLSTPLYFRSFLSHGLSEWPGWWLRWQRHGRVVSSSTVAKGVTEPVSSSWSCWSSWV